jgi:hypothetical protein
VRITSYSVALGLEETRVLDVGFDVDGLVTAVAPTWLSALLGMW